MINCKKKFETVIVKLLEFKIKVKLNENIYK